MALKIDGHGYSSAVLEKIAIGGGDCKSFQHGSRQLKKLAELSISPTHVANLTHEIGRGLIEMRDQQAELERFRQLSPDPDQPPVELACVEVDGGRMMTRAPEQSRGVHQQQWKEPKVGVLWRMTSQTFEEDPHPQLPRCFQDRERVDKLVREMHGGRTGGTEESEHGITLEEIIATAGADEPHLAPPRWQPKRIFRTCVATLRDVYGFGPLVAAEARKRGFYEARRKAFLGDGQEANWTVHRLHFPDFTPIADFMHAVSRAYAAAQILAPPDQLWEHYLTSATALWQGRVDEVIAELQTYLQQHPLPEEVPLKQIPDTDPRKTAHEALTYLQNNRTRMNYPEYRRQGMPVTSSLIESLIKEFNWRVKGTEKSWNRPEQPPTSRHTSRPVRGREHQLPDMSGESILQVRAALLCDDDRLSKYLRSRPGSPYVRRTSQKAAACAD
jgi:hypothetical protein